MSRATEDVLREAIIAHSRSEYEAEHESFDEDKYTLLCDWVICTHWASTDTESSNGYGRYTPNGQPYHRTLGLLQNAINDFEYVNLQARDRTEDGDD